MVRTLSLLLIIAFGLPAARPAPILKEPEKGALYLASKVGDKLEYEETVSGVRKEDERWVTAVDKHRGLVIVSFSFSPKKDESSDYRMGASADGVFRLPRQGEIPERPHRLLRLPAKEGDAWAEESRTDDDDPTTQYTTGKVEVVEVPAGKFTALRVEAVLKADGGMVRITYWWAAGVGMVKKVARGPGVDEVRVLKSFTPAAK
jgi:hypothetical protein